VERAKRCKDYAMRGETVLHIRHSEHLHQVLESRQPFGILIKDKKKVKMTNPLPRLLKHMFFPLLKMKKKNPWAKTIHKLEPLQTSPIK